MTPKQKIRLSIRLVVLAVIIYLSVCIGRRHGTAEGFVCFAIMGWLYDVRCFLQS